MHPLFAKADQLSGIVIDAAIEVHRHLGPGLVESVYERCLNREFELQQLQFANQQTVRIEYKGLVFEQILRCDILIANCLLVEAKAVETIHPVVTAQLFSYMKLLNVPVGLLINFHEPVLKNGISRLVLPGAGDLSVE